MELGKEPQLEGEPDFSKEEEIICSGLDKNEQDDSDKTTQVKISTCIKGWSDRGPSMFHLCCQMVLLGGWDVIGI